MNRRESARYLIAHDDGFYTRREVEDARRFLRETEAGRVVERRLAKAGADLRR